MSWYCKTCGEPIDYDEETEELPTAITIHMAEVIDHIFLELIKDGFVSDRERLYDIIMHYHDYIDDKIGDVFEYEEDDND